MRQVVLRSQPIDNCFDAGLEVMHAQKQVYSEYENTTSQDAVGALMICCLLLAQSISSLSP
jgi:hypothetical protein